MRLHRGAPVNISSSDLTGRQDTSRMSTSQVGHAFELQSCCNKTRKNNHFLFHWHHRRQTSSLFTVHSNTRTHRGVTEGKQSRLFSRQTCKFKGHSGNCRPSPLVSDCCLFASSSPLVLCAWWASCSPCRIKYAIATKELQQ